MMRSFKGLAAIAAFFVATPALADIPVAPLGEIYESYNDCFKVATNDGIKTDVLPSLGWSRAKMSSAGKKVADGPLIYGHSKRKPLIILTAAQGEGLCIVMARLDSTRSFDQFKSAWGGKLPAADKDGSITFFAEGHAIMLKQTGSADKPAMTIAVMTNVEKK